MNASPDASPVATQEARLSPLAKASMAMAAFIAMLRFVEMAQLEYGLRPLLLIAIMGALAIAVFAAVHASWGVLVGHAATLLSPVGAFLLFETHVSTTMGAVVATVALLLAGYVAAAHWGRPPVRPWRSGPRHAAGRRR